MTAEKRIVGRNREMFDELKKASMKRIRTITIVFGIIILLLLAVVGTSLMKFIQGPQDLYSLSVDELDGAYVEADIGFIIDVFAEYTEERASGATSTQKEYYIIPIGESEYMGLGVERVDTGKASQIADETYDYITGAADEIVNTMHVKGTIQKMEPELSGFYYEWFEETGFLDSEEVNKMALSYVLEPERVGLFENSTFFALLATGGILFVIMAVFLIRGLTGSSMSQVNKFIKENEGTISTEELESEYQNAVEFETLRIGKSYTFYLNNTSPGIVKNENILWAYLNKVTHRVNGIKVGTTNELILHTKNKQTHNVGMKREESITSALMQYAKNNPHILLGYSDDRKKAFKNDIDSLLNLSLQQEANAYGTEGTGPLSH